MYVTAVRDMVCRYCGGRIEKGHKFYRSEYGSGGDSVRMCRTCSEMPLGMIVLTRRWDKRYRIGGEV